MEKPRRPTPEEIRAADGKTLPDVIAPELDVLFCGINPGLYTAAVGHHFARPGNRFWKALHAGGFTPRVLNPWEEQELLRYGCGITNVVARATTAAAELTPAELAEGGRLLEARVARYAPRWLAVLGLGAYRTAFARPKAAMGPQEETVGGAGVWILPNPSGLNANYRPDDFARLFRELKDAAGSGRRG
ncbi:G/U mismatch-specific DNA glycosylase [Longimicrobium sp.]|uniref:G/U mismatch-specific DNA glycosylase n=1 Tax=Longimicrobium sp. TaxID=2029185 RepID=UPI002B8F381E|nr:G/U mismatch-specific DNA glycosylase [Longimicrobium sp.]HSU15134.1 G/U mismatch-specific DNA glycosylase [Longimicrobium sp.]